MVKIFIDPGHGGRDTGAVGHGLQEKTITLKIALMLRAILQATYDNVDVKMSRTTDQYVSLQERTATANRWNADFLLSIHINATPSGTGYEDFIYDGHVQPKTIEVQHAMNQEVVKQTAMRNRGKKRKNLHMLRESKMPAVLTETGFIDNPNDAEQLKSDSFLKRVALGHANGIERAFQLKRKDKPFTQQGVNNVLTLSKWQQEELANVYRHAREQGIFSSTEHETAVREQKMTMDQAIFLTTLMAGAALNNGKRL